MSHIKFSKISDYKIIKVLQHFCADVDATTTTYLLGITRNKVNRLYRLVQEVSAARG